MKNISSHRALVELAEEYRDSLPPNFATETDEIQSSLLQGHSLKDLVSKGHRAKKTSNARIRAAILRELSLFLCSNDPRYAELRKDSPTISRDTVHFIAGVLTTALGITSGAATACVAFVALACGKVAVGVFCELNPPPQTESK